MGARVNDARSTLAGTRKLFFDNVRSVNIDRLFGLGFDTGPRWGCWCQSRRSRSSQHW